MQDFVHQPYGFRVLTGSLGVSGDFAILQEESITEEGNPLLLAVQQRSYRVSFKGHLRVPLGVP